MFYYSDDFLDSYHESIRNVWDSYIPSTVYIQLVVDSVVQSLRIL